MNCRFASRFIIISSIFLINNMPTYIYLCALSVWSCFVWLFATVPSWIQLFGDCLLRDGMTRWQLRVWLHWKSVCSSHHFGKGRERAQSREKPMQRLQLLILSHCQSEEPHVDTLPGGFDWRELIPLRECAPPITTLGGLGGGGGGCSEVRWRHPSRSFPSRSLLSLLFLSISLSLPPTPDSAPASASSTPASQHQAPHRVSRWSLLPCQAQKQNLPAPRPAQSLMIIWQRNYTTHHIDITWAGETDNCQQDSSKLS